MRVFLVFLISVSLLAGCVTTQDAGLVPCDSPAGLAGKGSVGYGVIGAAAGAASRRDRISPKEGAAVGVVIGILHGLNEAEKCRESTRRSAGRLPLGNGETISISTNRSGGWAEGGSGDLFPYVAEVLLQAGYSPVRNGGDFELEVQARRISQSGYGGWSGYSADERSYDVIATLYDGDRVAAVARQYGVVARNYDSSDTYVGGARQYTRERIVSPAAEVIVQALPRMFGSQRVTPPASDERPTRNSHRSSGRRWIQ